MWCDVHNQIECDGCYTHYGDIEDGHVPATHFGNVKEPDLCDECFNENS
jgi:hypothetical protein